MTASKPQPIDFLYSAFDKINSYKRPGQARKEFANYIKKDFAFRSVIQGAFHKKIQFSLPQGTPEGFDLINSPGATNAKKLFKSGEIKQFVGRPGTATPQIESKWVGWLESIDPLDVKVLEAMKDKRLPAAYPVISRDFIVASLGTKEAKSLIGD